MLFHRHLATPNFSTIITLKNSKHPMLSLLVFPHTNLSMNTLPHTWQSTATPDPESDPLLAPRQTLTPRQWPSWSLPLCLLISTSPLIFLPHCSHSNLDPLPCFLTICFLSYIPLPTHSPHNSHINLRRLVIISVMIAQLGFPIKTILTSNTAHCSILHPTNSWKYFRAGAAAAAIVNRKFIVFRKSYSNLKTNLNYTLCSIF